MNVCPHCGVRVLPHWTVCARCSRPLSRPEPVAFARQLYAREMADGFGTFHGAVAIYAEILGADGLAEYRRLAAEAGRKGGQSVPGAKRSFSQDRNLAAVAGRKGGQSVPDEKRSFSQHPELAAEAGRKGGQASHSGR